MVGVGVSAPEPFDGNLLGKNELADDANLKSGAAEGEGVATTSSTVERCWDGPNPERWFPRRARLTADARDGMLCGLVRLSICALRSLLGVERTGFETLGDDPGDADSCGDALV